MEVNGRLAFQATAGSDPYAAVEVLMGHVGNAAPEGVIHFLADESFSFQFRHAAQSNRLGTSHYLPPHVFWCERTASQIQFQEQFG
jgi:hypothetical protein